MMSLLFLGLPYTPARISQYFDYLAIRSFGPYRSSLLHVIPSFRSSLSPACIQHHPNLQPQETEIRILLTHQPFTNLKLIWCPLTLLQHVPHFLRLPHWDQGWLNSICITREGAARHLSPHEARYLCSSVVWNHEGTVRMQRKVRRRRSRSQCSAFSRLLLIIWYSDYQHDSLCFISYHRASRVLVESVKRACRGSVSIAESVNFHVNRSSPWYEFQWLSQAENLMETMRMGLSDTPNQRRNLLMRQ